MECGECCRVLIRSENNTLKDSHLAIVRACLTKHAWRNFNFAPRCACTHTLFKSMCKIFLKLANEPIIEQQLVPFRQMVKSLAEGQSRHQNREETGLKWLWSTWLLMLMSVWQPANLLGLSPHHSHLYGLQKIVTKRENIEWVGSLCGGKYLFHGRGQRSERANPLGSNWKSTGTRQKSSE